MPRVLDFYKENHIVTCSMWEQSRADEYKNLHTGFGGRARCVEPPQCGTVVMKTSHWIQWLRGSSSLFTVPTLLTLLLFTRLPEKKKHNGEDIIQTARSITNLEEDAYISLFSFPINVTGIHTSLGKRQHLCILFRKYHVDIHCCVTDKKLPMKSKIAGLVV